MSETSGNADIDDREITRRLGKKSQPEIAPQCVRAARRIYKATAQWPWNFANGFAPRTWSRDNLQNLATLVETYDSSEVHDYIHLRTSLKAGQNRRLKSQDLFDAKSHFAKRCSSIIHTSVELKTEADAVQMVPAEKRQLIASEAPNQVKRIRLRYRGNGEKSTSSADGGAGNIEDDGPMDPELRVCSEDVLGISHEEGDQVPGPERDSTEPSSAERGNTEQGSTEQGSPEPNRAKKSRQEAKQTNHSMRDTEVTLHGNAAFFTPDSQPPTSIIVKRETSESTSSFSPTPYRIPKEIYDNACVAFDLASDKYTSSTKAITDIRLAIHRDAAPLIERRRAHVTRIHKLQEDLRKAENDHIRASEGRQNFMAGQANFFMDQETIKYNLDRYAAKEESSGAEKIKLGEDLEKERAFLVIADQKLAETKAKNKARYKEITVIEANGKKHQSEKMYWEAMVLIVGMEPTYMIYDCGREKAFFAGLSPSTF
ncbi:hypothetical protein FGRMN_5113 [Fusarium graminum]|nr:hypothetical protein FGRMN_5113 [Fusarium graminum]